MLEIDDARLEKACKIAMIGKKVMIAKLKEKAEVYGRTSAYDEIETIINRRS
jgi:hypothetical protein